MNNKIGQSRMTVIAIAITTLTVFILMTNSSASGDTIERGNAFAAAGMLSSSGLVFGNDRIEVHHVVVKAHSKLDLKFKGGSIVVLTDFPFRVDLPLTGSTTTQLSAGDVIRIPAGEYPIENSSEKNLEFLSVELGK
jgi:hypothetical protein